MVSMRTNVISNARCRLLRRPRSRITGPAVCDGVHGGDRTSFHARVYVRLAWRHHRRAVDVYADVDWKKRKQPLRRLLFLGVLGMLPFCDEQLVELTAFHQIIFGFLDVLAFTIRGSLYQE